MKPIRNLWNDMFTLRWMVVNEPGQQLDDSTRYLAILATLTGCQAALSLDETACVHLYHTFKRLMEQIQEGDFTPNIIYRGNEPVEYAVLPLTQFGPEYHSVEFETVSSMLSTYYSSRDTLNRIPTFVFFAIM